MRNSLLLVCAALLAGCSPHPGSGTWLAEEGARDFTRLSIQFDGRAEFFGEGVETAVERCFWSGDSAEVIQLECVVAANIELKRSYLLQVTGERQALLLRDGDPVGGFRRVEE